VRALPIRIGPWPSHIQIPCSFLISNDWETTIGDSKANPSASDFSVLRHRMGPLYRKRGGRKCIQMARRRSADLSDLPFDPGDNQVARPRNDTLARDMFSVPRESLFNAHEISPWRWIQPSEGPRWPRLKPDCYSSKNRMLCKRPRFQVRFSRRSGLGSS
jgi:hypothetical protein